MYWCIGFSPNGLESVHCFWRLGPLMKFIFNIIDTCRMTWNRGSLELCITVVALFILSLILPKIRLFYLLLSLDEVYFILIILELVYLEVDVYKCGNTLRCQFRLVNMALYINTFSWRLSGFSHLSIMTKIIELWAIRRIIIVYFLKMV